MVQDRATRSTLLSSRANLDKEKDSATEALRYRWLVTTGIGRTAIDPQGRLREHMQSE